MTAPPLLRRSLASGIVAILLAAALALGPAPAHAATATTCAASFQVLHDNRIGSLELPQGSYAVTVTGITCSQAVSLFTAFLDRWDGKLPKPWRYTARAIGQGTFTGANGQQFSVAHTTPPAADNPQPANGLVCPQSLTLTQADRIGPLSLAKGSYTITRLSAASPSCPDTAVLLSRFLQDFDGKLADGWTVRPSDASLVRDSGADGFHLDRTAAGAGALSFPTRSARCPATFRVGHNVRVARLTFPAGTYWINILRPRGVTCRKAASLFASFLRQRAGRLPRPWVLDTATGTFRRGRTSTYGFQTKPTFLVG